MLCSSALKTAPCPSNFFSYVAPQTVGAVPIDDLLDEIQTLDDKQAQLPS